MKKSVDHKWLGVLWIVLSITQAGSAAADGSGGNWLANPGFENGVFYWQDNIREIVTPEGWWAYWREAPPPGLALPNNCPRVEDTACYWARPEFQPIDGHTYTNRVHSGRWAVKYFSYARMHEAGLFQHVDGLPPGSRLRFSIWMQAWMCSVPSACQGGKRSDAPARMHLQVGIDPNGGWDPWSQDVVWSSEGESFDKWTLFQVEAQLSSYSSSATVFTRSRAEWGWPRINNDLYVDDARLEVVNEEATTIQAGSTLAVAKYITHTVAQGETLLSIALRYGISTDWLVEINELSSDFYLTPGDAVLIPGNGAQASAAVTIPEFVPSPSISTWSVETRKENHGAQSATLAGTQIGGVLLALVLGALLFAGTIRFVRQLDK